MKKIKMNAESRRDQVKKTHQLYKAELVQFFIDQGFDNKLASELTHSMRCATYFLP